jgi:hypothetical protein
MKKKIVLKFRKEEALDETLDESKEKLKAHVMGLLNINNVKKMGKEVEEGDNEGMNIMDGDFKMEKGGEWIKMDDNVVEVRKVVIHFIYIFFYYN